MIFTDRKIYFIIAVMKQKINLKIKKTPTLLGRCLCQVSALTYFPGRLPAKYLRHE